MSLRDELIEESRRENNKIFTITVIYGNPRLPYADERMRVRSWGYYFKQEDAAHVIEHNETDISELGYYQYGLLAELGEGPLALADELQWYEFIWNYDTEPRKHDGMKVPEFVEARKIERPPQYEGYCFGGF
jgi:hypothetical protein